MKRLWTDEDWRMKVFLCISLPALVLSFCEVKIAFFDFAWVAIVLCGYPILKGAFFALVTQFNIRAGLLVSMAIIASIAVDELFAAGEVAFIMGLGELLENFTLKKARKGIENLVNLMPRTARLISNTTESIVPADTVLKDSMVRVLAGETIPVDGIVVSGTSSVDQSIMTGESLPVDKTAGDSVFSGTLNQMGVLEIRASADAQNSSVQRMVQLVESAAPQKSRIVRLVDRWATWIVIIAFASAIGTYFLTGEVLRSVSILVVFCPCALVLATPTAVMAAVGNATRHGILVRQGDVIERLSQIRLVAFDKTGTLTQGNLQVIHVESFQMDSDAFLSFLSAMESRSQHPMAQAITRYCDAQKIVGTLPVDDVQWQAGQGLSAKVDGVPCLAGNDMLLKEHNVLLENSVREGVSPYIHEGATVIWVARAQTCVGYVVLSDTLRVDAPELVQSLHQLELKTILLSGDHTACVEAVGEQVHIDSAYGQLLPEDKLRHIAEREAHDGYVCMIGDGVNDAPSLKSASVGIAMGGIGSDVAIEAADAIVVNNHLSVVAHLFALARRTITTIHCNLAFSLIFNFVAITLAASGLLSPFLGAIVHNISSILVVLNSARILHWDSSFSKSK